MRPERSTTPAQKHLRKTRLLAIVAAVIFLVVGGYFLGRMLETGAKPPEPRGNLEGRFEEPPTVIYEGVSYRRQQNITTVLLMGVDTAGRDESIAVNSFRNGGQSDFLLLMVMDHEKKTVTPVQIDRDTMAEITILGVLGNVAGTRNAQICLSHGFGDGKEQSCLFTVEAVEKLFLGMPIDFYVAMDLDGIAVLNDTLGGVTVTLEDDFSALDPAMTPGTTMTLRGKQAEYYVRNRMNIGIGTNESRAVRQRAYLKALGDLLDQKLHASSSFVGELFDALAATLQSNMKRGRMINEAWSTKDYVREEIVRPQGEYATGEDGFIEFHVDEKQMEGLVLSLFYAPVE